MKISCEVIEDLLPLYHDGVCSGDSRKLVEEHLKTCPKCGKLNEELDGEPEEKALDDKKAIQGIRKNIRKRTLRGIALGMVLVLLAAACGVGLYLARWNKEREAVLRFVEGKSDLKIYRHIQSDGLWDGKDEYYQWSDGGYRFLVSIPDPFQGKPVVTVCSLDLMSKAQMNDWSEPYLWIELEGFDADGYDCRVGVSKWDIGLYETFLLRVIREEDRSGFELVEGSSTHRLLWEGNREQIDAFIAAAEAQWPFLTE